MNYRVVPNTVLIAIVRTVPSSAPYHSAPNHAAPYHSELTQPEMTIQEIVLIRLYIAVTGTCLLVTKLTQILPTLFHCIQPKQLA